MLVDSGDLTRTAKEPAAVPTLSKPERRRLAAPLQVRDPDRYEILGEHGRGGLGRVSRAHDTELGRHVAIKELLSRGDIGEIRFLREALITARLEHPGIVPVHEAGRWPDGTPFYVMKLVAGRSLKELLAEHTTVDARLALLHHVIAVADAVAYAHRRKIIHRDLKPANVVVGDFGETVVIDWGLAKDLTTAEDATVENSPYRATPLDDLTATGSVVGTPMYMAPEQYRGEPVDARADVFAIGAMLWELCSLRRVPPTDARQRHRILRSNGIDNDLITIIDKALAQDRHQRYADAGELADDLKAFKSGARIAARRYSLLDMLAHWTRRNRALAVTLSSAGIIGIVGTIVFVTNVTSERDRADAALTASETQQQRAEQANNELVLQNAELLLQRDPTAAVAAVADYRGNDEGRRERLLAEAEGRGVARAVLTAHSDTVAFLVGDASGAVFSLAEDHKVRVTRGTTSSTIADNVSTAYTSAYADTIRVLVYATAPSGIAVLDLKTQAATRIEAATPTALAIAPDGSRIASLDARRRLTVWKLAPVEVVYEQELPSALQLMFADATRLVVREKTGLRAISFGSGRTETTVTALETSTFEARNGDVVIGDKSGRIMLLTPALRPTAPISVCRDRVNNVRIAAQARVVTFACQDGVAGVARYDDRRRITVESFSTKVPAITAEPDVLGERIVVVVESSDVFLYDVHTGLVARYEGQGTLVATVAAPSPGFDHVLVGDVNGTVRVYDLPSRDARLLLRAPQAVYAGTFSPDGETIVANGSDHEVRRAGLRDRKVTELKGHEDFVRYVRFSADGASFLSCSNDGTVRVWSPANESPIRIFSQHEGAVGDAHYVDEGSRIASVGDDGRLLLWSTNGDDVSTLFTHPSSLVALEVLAHNHHIVVHDASGGVWDVTTEGVAKQVRSADSADIRMLRASPDGRLLAIGTADGRVTIYETSGYTALHTTTLPDSIRQINFDPQNREILISTEAGRVRRMSLDARRSIPWRDLAVGALDVSYSPDGDTIAFACATGGAWLNRVHDDAWAYARDHATVAQSARFSPDGTRLVTTDRRGNVVVRDVRKTFATKERGSK